VQIWQYAALTCGEYCRWWDSLQRRTWCCNRLSNRTAIDAYLQLIVISRKPPELCKMLRI